MDGLENSEIFSGHDKTDRRGTVFLQCCHVRVRRLCCQGHCQTACQQVSGWRIKHDWFVCNVKTSKRFPLKQCGSSFMTTIYKMTELTGVRSVSIKTLMIKFQLLKMCLSHWSCSEVFKCKTALVTAMVPSNCGYASQTTHLWFWVFF